jgi:tetratricopeptide (TPR) repeat protein
MMLRPRSTVMLIAGIVSIVFGAVQVESMALYGDLAQAPALPALVPPGWGRVFDDELRSTRVPSGVRAAYAKALLHRGDVAGATTIVGGLPPGREADDLRGQLAALVGRSGDAFAAFARAGDFERAQALIDARADTAEAVRGEAALVAALDGPGEEAVRARALWRLDPAERMRLERAALDEYDRALALAPNEETYLLAAGEQALTIGARARALGYYERALTVVPASADARAGLQRARS